MRGGIKFWIGNAVIVEADKENDNLYVKSKPPYMLRLCCI